MIQAQTCMHMHTHVHTDIKVAVAGQQIVKQVCVVSLLLDHSGTQYEHKCIHTYTNIYKKQQLFTVSWI
jgi:hypothetical protein